MCAPEASEIIEFITSREIGFAHQSALDIVFRLNTCNLIRLGHINKIDADNILVGIQGKPSEREKETWGHTGRDTENVKM
jgi:hypothetical protein